MTTSIPTEVGDVLILYYTGADDTHAVCAVTEAGQQGLKPDHSFAPTRDAAVVTATRLLMPGRRIYLGNTRTGEWEAL